MNAVETPNTRRALSFAIVLYLLWVFATYLLEGRIHTLLRPEAMGARLSYALVANILIGIVGSALVIRVVSRGGTWVCLLRIAGRSVLEPCNPTQRLRPGAGGLHSRGDGVLGRDRGHQSGRAARRSRQMGFPDPRRANSERVLRRLPLRPQPSVQHRTPGRVPELDRVGDERVLLR